MAFRGNFSKAAAVNASRNSDAGVADQEVIKQLFKALVLSNESVTLSPISEYTVKLGGKPENDLVGLNFKVRGLDTLNKVSLLYADIARICDKEGVSITAGGTVDNDGNFVEDEEDTESFYSQKVPPVITLTPSSADIKIDWRRRQDGTPYYALREYAGYTNWTNFLAKAKQNDPKNPKQIKEGGDIQPAITKLVATKKFKNSDLPAVDNSLKAMDKKYDTVAKASKFYLPQLDLIATFAHEGTL